MQVKIKIKRYNPSKNPSPYIESFDMDISPRETILNILLKIRNEQDQTLGLRCSCRSAICGSCAMKINRKSGLACNTQLEKVIDEKGEVLIEPAGNMKVIRDLIVDFTMFWDKIKSTTPYLQPTGPKPNRENICTNEDMLHLSKVTECIMCGSCVSDCTILEVDKKFLGPAALAKIYRFVADPRDGIDDSRLSMASASGGMWDCTHCFKCVEVCPKGVLPMERIVALRKIAIERGYTNNTGARHSEAINDSVEHSGTLNEMMVLPKSHGWWNIKELLALIPGGIRFFKNGKMPSLIHPKIPSANQIKKIFHKYKK